MAQKKYLRNHRTRGGRQASSHRSFNRGWTGRSLPHCVAPVLAETGTRLLAAQSPEEIVKAVREDAAGIAGSLVQFSELILKILHDPKFPQRLVGVSNSFLV
jgi:hypothetical protein